MRWFLCSTLMAGGLVLARAAGADVTKPFPGVTMVTEPGQALVIADLCAPGVSVRATKYAERKRTPQSWGELVGAEAAINADFFDFPAATLVDGRARGGGQEWPADKQLIGLNTRGEDRHYWQFGKLLGADPVEPTSAPPAAANVATEIIGGHNVLVRNGKSLAPSFDGDGVLKSAARRSAVGTNKERSILYLYSSSNSMTGSQLTASLLALASQGGAPDIDFASNLDGGGSSQMYVKGRGQIVTSGRLVANHLGIMAKGSGPAPMCPGKRPVGYLDAVDCEKVAGWSLDPDDPDEPLDVTLFYEGFVFDPKAHVIDVHADLERPDLKKPYGTTNHGYAAFPPLSLFDGKEHPVWAVAKDSAGGRPSILEGSPKKLTCTASPPASVKRHIVNRETLEAWKLDQYFDQLTLDDAKIAAFADGSAIDAPPAFVRLDDGGTGTVYLVEGGTRRRVVDKTSLRAWRVDPASLAAKSATDLRALSPGPALRARPMLTKGDKPEVYLLDALPTESDPDDPLLAQGKGGGGSSSGASGGDPKSGGASAGDDSDDGCSAARNGSRSPFAALGLSALVAIVALRRRRRRPAP